MGEEEREEEEGVEETKSKSEQTAGLGKVTDNVDEKEISAERVKVKAGWDGNGSGGL